MSGGRLPLDCIDLDQFARLAKCTKLGTGPSCSRNKDNPDVGKRATERCLEDVKELCDEKFKECVEECARKRADYEERQLALEDAALRAFRAKAKAQAEREAQCRGSQASKDEYKKIEEMGGQLIRQGSELGSQSGQFWCNPALRQGNFANMYDLSGATNSNINDNWPQDRNCNGPLPEPPIQPDINGSAEQTYTSFLKAYDDQVDKWLDMCAQPPLIFTSPIDATRLALEAEELELTCLASCENDRVQDCDTSHCYCGSYECEAGTIEDLIRNGLGESTETGQTALSSLATDSAYDIPIELVYTKAFMPGNIIWCSEPRTVKRRVSTPVYVGDVLTGNAVKTVLATFIDFSVGVCAGEADDVTRVWLDGELVLDKTSSGTLLSPLSDSLTIAFTTGSEFTLPDDGEMAVEGEELTPAYRGLAVLRISNLEITSRKSFPDLKIEVVRRTGVQDVESQTSESVYDSSFFEYDRTSREFRVLDSDGFVVGVDSYTLEALWSSSVSDVVSMSPNGVAVSVTSGDLTLSHPSSALVGDTITPLVTPDFVALFKWNDRVSAAAVVADSAGGLEIIPFDDSLLEFDTNRVFEFNTIEHDGFTSAIRTTRFFANADIPGVGLAEDTLFLVGVHDTSITAVVGVLSTQRENVELLENWGINQYTISDVHPSPSTVTVKGAAACEYDSSLIIACSFDGQDYLLKWTPEDGVVWSTKVDSLPVFGKTPFIAAGTNTAEFMWTSSGGVFIVDLTDGSVSALDDATVSSISGGVQMYDPSDRSLVYVASNSKIVRALPRRIATDADTLEDVVNDLLVRSGSPLPLVRQNSAASVFITGFRSENKLTGKAILDELMEVYLVSKLEDSGIVLRTLSESDTYEVDAAYALGEVSTQIASDNVASRDVTLSYYSVESDGEREEQTHRSPIEYLDNDRVDRNSYSVLETNQYMVLLAELLGSVVNEAESKVSFSLPPRFIALVPAMTVTLSSLNLRVKTVSVGADLSLAVTANFDTSEKYEESPIIPPGRVVPRVLITDTDPEFVPDIHIVVVRPINQAVVNGYEVFCGLRDVRSPTQPVLMSPITSISDPYPASNALAYESLQLHGVLTAAPPTTTAAFSTQDASLTIMFDSETVANSALAFFSAQQIQSLSADPRVLSYDHNLIMVGEEPIQFGSVSQDIGDGRLLTFTGLMRYRGNADVSSSHYIGEDCFVVTPSTTFRDEVNSNLRGTYAKYGAFSTSGLVKTRTSRVPDKLLVNPPVVMLRQDVVPSINESLENPSNPHVVFYMRQRSKLGDTFTDFVDFEANLASRTYEVYILRGDFDQTMFDAERTGTGTSYIMVRDEIQTEATLDELPDETIFGYVWLAIDQDDASWDAATEQTTVVVVETTLADIYGEVLSVFKWTAGNYYDYPVRGLQG